MSVLVACAPEYDDEEVENVFCREHPRVIEDVNSREKLCTGQFA